MLSYTLNNNNQNTFYFRASDVISRTDKTRGPTYNLSKTKKIKNKTKEQREMLWRAPAPHIQGAEPFRRENVLHGARVFGFWPSLRETVPFFLLVSGLPPLLSSLLALKLLLSLRW